MKRLITYFLCSLLAWAPTSQAALKAVAGPSLPLSVANGGTGGTTATTAAASLGTPTKIAQWTVSVYMAPSGTMGNNGAVTLGTALDRIYSEGLWLYYPAGAVAAGVPASATFLWTVMSSTTAGTVYNSTFDGLSVPAVGVTTAYVTTGPGAFTGVTAATTAITVTVPANTLGATGQLVIDWVPNQNNAAGNKTHSLFYSTTGGTDYGATLTTQSTAGNGRAIIRNQTTAIQTGTALLTFQGTVSSGSGLKSSAADTTGSTTIVFRFTNATATNWMGISGGSVLALPV
jgi:hypothetical protein